MSYRTDDSSFFSRAAVSDFSWMPALRLGARQTFVEMTGRVLFPCFRLSWLLLLLLLVNATGRASLMAFASQDSVSATPRLHVVLLNGGGRPSINYYSHLRHIKLFTTVLRSAGISSRDIAVFNADGTKEEADFAVRDPLREPSFWLLQGTPLEQPLKPPIRLENSTIEDFSPQPATRAALQQWFDETAPRFKPGDTVLFYVTDHGTKNSDDLTNNRITLWGEKETLSVNELREMFSRIDPQVRVVMLMSQCFSGSFANLMFNQTQKEFPSGNVCGFFSSTADREAYGCYPENRDKDNVGHSFAFLEHLAAGVSLPEAHRGVLVTDQTPDVPLKTSEVYLEKLLDEVAQRRGQKLDTLLDELLTRAWLDKSQWETEIRLLDRIAQAFGYFSPRSVAELQEHAQFLPTISDQFSTYGKAWDAALRALTSENLSRFLTFNDNWQSRLDAKVLATLAADDRSPLVSALLSDLMIFTERDTSTQSRLRRLREKSESASKAYYRMQVRLAVVLRMRAILTSIAGRQYLAQGDLRKQRTAYEALTMCENVSLGGHTSAPVTLNAREEFPSYDGERQLAEQVLPGWLGISFKQASASVRDQRNLKEGANVVQAVYPDSPAQRAGLEVGDIIIGPPELPFVEPQQIREWVMTAAIGTPAALKIVRGEKSLQVAIIPQRYPLKWPSLPEPPQVGSVMPQLPALKLYRGTWPAEVSSGSPYLLFFWATWCGPCKASLPEVVAFAREKGVPVIAITDEPAAQIEEFFKQYDGPFPAIIATDELRKAFLAYGVRGTPTFVLADSAGKVQSRATGYSVEKGLPLAGWSWTEKKTTVAPSP